MLAAESTRAADSSRQVATLRADIKRLTAENARLRADNHALRLTNRQLHTALDAHVTRAGRPGLFGPLEMSAGTCIGPQRPRSG